MEKSYEFEVMITSRHSDLNDQLKNTIVKDMLKLSRFHSHIIDGSVIIEKNNSYFKAEVSVRVPGLTINAAQEDYNEMKAIDIAIGKAKTQLKKLKSKVVDHRAPQIPAAETTTTDVSEETE